MIQTIDIGPYGTTTIFDHHMGMATTRALPRGMKADLARAAGVHPQTVAAWLRGERVRPSTLRRITDALRRAREALAALETERGAQ